MRKIIFITGVSGSGKSTIAAMLSKRLEIPFIDADDFHDPESIQKMKSGLPLSDDDRKSWLERLNSEASNSSQLIIACSALKNNYRSELSKGLTEEEYYFFHLQGSFELISERMQKRQDHFMPQSLLKSQFDCYESPLDGHIIEINQSTELIVNQILDLLEVKSVFGIIGLGVMGTSLARNIAAKDYSLSIFNRHLEGKEEDVAELKKGHFKELADAKPFDNLSQFVSSLARPRSIMLMVNAGKSVDLVIDELLPFLEPGDLIIDGGNSHYQDTQRRLEALQNEEINFLGCGISGGEQGALLGPSIMVGGNLKAYTHVQQILEHIAADAPSGGKCCSFIGSGGSGHFVKMVHNGIEYGEMQLIAEVYSIFRYSIGYSTNQIADTFKQWASEGCNSYLLETSQQILIRKDDSGQLILDQILDKAGNKGTGSWTTIAAAQLGVPTPTLTAALNARFQSSYKKERVDNSKRFASNVVEIDLDPKELKNLYQFGRIMNHHQGIWLIKEASKEFNWEINLKSLLKVWSAGCIIRSQLLIEISNGLGLGDFLHTDYFTSYINDISKELIISKSKVTTSGLPTPCLSASVDYYNALIQDKGNANMIQAQRDYFGAHTYQRIDDNSGLKHHTNWT